MNTIRYSYQIKYTTGLQCHHKCNLRVLLKQSWHGACNSKRMAQSPCHQLRITIMTVKADTHTFTGTPVEKAYNQMRHLIRNEWEFPDACFKAASWEDVPYETLADFYDEMNATN